MSVLSLCNGKKRRRRRHADEADVGSCGSCIHHIGPHRSYRCAHYRVDLAPAAGDSANPIPPLARRAEGRRRRTLTSPERLTKRIAVVYAEPGVCAARETTLNGKTRARVGVGERGSEKVIHMEPNKTKKSRRRERSVTEGRSNGIVRSRDHSMRYVEAWCAMWKTP